jgi:Fe-S cluster biogenesis protein NfuA
VRGPSLRGQHPLTPEAGARGVKWSIDVITADEKRFQHRMQRIEELVQEIEKLPDPAAQGLARELVQALMDVHGAGLAAMLELAAAAGPAGRNLIDVFADNGMVASLLLLYGLHPEDLAVRVRRALEKVRPYLQSHGGNVELLGVEGSTVRLRMEGSCQGCPSSAVTLKQSIEEAIYEAAPDVTAILVEGETRGSAPTPSGMVSLPLVDARTAFP